MRRLATSFVAAGMGAVIVAATLDALRGSSSGGLALRTPGSTPASSPAAGAPERLPECSAPQLELVIEILGGSASLALRHVSGAPCHLTPRRARMRLQDRRGRRLQLVVGEGFQPGTFSGDFRAGFEQLVNVTFLPRCAPEAVPKGPFLLTARAGPYRAQRRLRGLEIGCFGGG